MHLTIMIQLPEEVDTDKGRTEIQSSQSWLESGCHYLTTSVQ